MLNSGYWSRGFLQDLELLSTSQYSTLLQFPCLLQSVCYNLSVFSKTTDYGINTSEDVWGYANGELSQNVLKPGSHS